MNPSVLQLAVPVIGSNDVVETVNYFERVLGFTQQWIWGDPPVYAGVRSGDAQLYVCHDPDIANAIRDRGLAPDIFLWVRGIQSLYESHVASSAEIVEPLQVKPWGSLQYTIREPNGYRLKFAELQDGK